MGTLTKNLSLLVLLLVLQIYPSAQEKPDIKFGKVSAADFDLSKHQFDTSAGAVYIADVGSTEFEGNTKGWFSTYFKRQLRIKILNKNGFDAATFEIPLYDAGTDEERLEKLRAVCYNIEDGKVVESKLEEKSVFKEKYTKNYYVKKFTVPAVKEGSIIEVSYYIKSDFIFNLQPWRFQGQFPRLWSEYVVRIPECFNYVFLTQGYHPFHIKKQDLSYKTYSIVQDNGTQSNDTYTMKANVYDHRWVMKNVPPMKEEKFVTSLDNYIAKIEFQLSEYREPLVPKRIMNDWFKLSADLMKREDFGFAVERPNNWLDDDMRKIVAGATTELEKAKKIYAYVRNNFTCTNQNGLYLREQLKTVFKNKNGNVADINLLLIAMLRHENIKVDPILLSTRSNGLTHELYPLIDRFNYVIAGMTIDTNIYFLDATEPKLGFGKLPIRCYNGHARFIDPNSPDPIYFLADTLKEAKVTSVFISNTESGKFASAYNSKLGFYESLSLRDKIAEKGKDEVLKTLKTQYPAEYELNAFEIDSLNNPDLPVEVHYTIDLNSFQEDIVYFNPMMAEGYKDNYFKSADRKYPVEMPYSADEVYILNMEIPKGYVVDEIPKSARVNLNETDGAFEYLISQSSDRILLRSRIRINRASFDPADYEGLRNFFDYIVKKHNEQIVFKKKK
ncbi:MAG TPA: transglutaminase domain-containing protein [Chitinophagaceae bacterium]